MKKALCLTLLVAAAVAFSSGYGLAAGKLTTYLAPQYQDVPFKAETAFLSAMPVIDQKDPKKPAPVMFDVTDPYEKMESPSPKGMKIEPSPGNGEYAKDIVPYLTASAEMVDSAKLRVIARMKKLALIMKSGNQAYAEFYKKYVTAPLALFIGFNAGTGPACGPLPLHLGLKDGGYYFFNTVIFIEDIKDAFSVADAIKNDTFDMVVAHENAHGMMFDLYGPDIAKIDKKSNLGHDGPMVSDRGVAFIEGWAEAFEALYGPTNPVLKLKEEDRKKYRISEFLFTRQEPVRRDRYVWQNYRGKKTGLLKNGLQLLSTEGVVAGLFYDILTSRAIKDPFGKSVSVMFLHRPTDFIKFLNGWVREFPEDKQVLYRIFLETTNYATMSNEARSLYYEYYQAKLKYVQKQMDEKAFYAVKNKWAAFKEELFKKAMADGNLTANVGPDLWMNVRGMKNFSLGGLLSNILGIDGAHLNVSLVTPEQFELLVKNKMMKEVTAEDIQKLVAAREQMGVLPYKTATEALREILGKDRASKIIKENGISDMN